MSPIVQNRPTFPILGRIALGYQKRSETKGTTYPARSDTLVFSAEDMELLEYVARALGGEVKQVPAEDSRWFVITTTRELHIRLPSDDERAFSQWMERWGQGGLIRRCDGVTCQFSVNTDGAEREVQRDIPCICEAEQLADDERCDPTTRLNVVVEELAAIPRLGLWQVTSRGWDSSREVSASIELLQAAGTIVGVPLRLRVEERTRRAKDGKSYSFPVFTLVPLVSFLEAGRPRPKGLTAGMEGSSDAIADRTTTAATWGEGSRSTGAAVFSVEPPPENATAAYVPAEQTDDAAAIESLRAQCKELLGHIGLKPDEQDRIWKAVRPAGDLKLLPLTRLRFKRFFRALYGRSIGEDEQTAVKTALAENLQRADEEDVPF